MRILGILSDRNHKRIVRSVAHQFGIEIDFFAPDEILDIDQNVIYNFVVLSQEYPDYDETCHQIYGDLKHGMPELSHLKYIVIQNANEEIQLPNCIFVSEFSIEEELSKFLSQNLKSSVHSTHEAPQHKTILYISDDRLMHAIIKDLFKGESTEIRHAYDGASGYELYKETHPDLIVSDLDIPIMDGFQLLDKIKCQDSDDHTSILLFSSTHDEATIMKAYSLKAKGYLVKPMQPQVFKSKVLKYLSPTLH